VIAIGYPRPAPSLTASDLVFFTLTIAGAKIRSNENQFIQSPA
jgi:hypothetical protein